MDIYGKLFKKRPAVYRITGTRSSEELGPWAPHFPDFTEIVGHSSLGHIFLRNPESQNYAVLHPLKGAAKAYGKHESVAGFEERVLREPGFESIVLRADHVQAIARRLGPLGAEEIYFPSPYPFMGGSDAPETYDKGDLWVFIQIVAQMRGVR